MIKLNHKLHNFINSSQSFKFDYDMSNINWFRVGGKADLMFRPKDKEELATFLQLKGDLPIFVMGVGSNIIIRDKGFRGCIIRLGRPFTEIKQLDTDIIEVGAANLDINVANYAQKLAISNFEFLSGIPGTIGGAIKMNAGAYGMEMSDILLNASGYDLEGNFYQFSNGDMNYEYRRSNPPKDLIYISAILKGKKGSCDKIANEIKKIQEARENTQPIRSRTGGSTFKNPKGYKVWDLIDKSGCRGLNIGDAYISNKHCNFMINEGNASAADLENLGELVRKKVKEKFSIDIEWEIKIIGEK